MLLKTHPHRGQLDTAGIWHSNRMTFHELQRDAALVEHLSSHSIGGRILRTCLCRKHTEVAIPSSTWARSRQTQRGGDFPSAPLRYRQRLRQAGNLPVVGPRGRHPRFCQKTKSNLTSEDGGVGWSLNRGVSWCCLLFLAIEKI